VTIVNHEKRIALFNFLLSNVFLKTYVALAVVVVLACLCLKKHTLEFSVQNTSRYPIRAVRWTVPTRGGEFYVETSTVPPRTVFGVAARLECFSGRFRAYVLLDSATCSYGTQYVSCTLWGGISAGVVVDDAFVERCIRAHGFNGTDPMTGREGVH
jgi:hypothetical protein